MPPTQNSALPANTEKKFLRALSGQPNRTPPVWLMRQAGRYLPEYRAIRAKAKNFLDFCYTPALATEATLQPIRRFGFDAAILFSDILVIPDALGQSVTFEVGEGPRLDAFTSPDAVNRLSELSISRLDPVFETIERVKSALPAETTFLGFCGAPWTVASYMVAGRGTPDQSPARLFAYRFPIAFQLLIDKLVDASVRYLSYQIEAGVEAVQIFDSWAGVLPAAEFQRWCVEPVARIISALRTRHPSVKIIAFPRGGGSHLSSFSADTGADALSLDTAIDPKWAKESIPSNVVLQGHLDPLALVVGGVAQTNGVREILAAYRDRAHIFNLGHGILPQTPVEHVEALLRQIRSPEV